MKNIRIRFNITIRKKFKMLTRGILQLIIDHDCYFGEINSNPNCLFLSHHIIILHYFLFFIYL